MENFPVYSEGFDLGCRPNKSMYSLNLTTSFRKIFSVRTPGHPLIIPKHCHERYRKILSNEVAWPISFIYLCIYFPY